MQFNWQVRFKNPLFWVTFIPQVLLAVQVILIPFGIMWDYTPLSNQLVAIVDAVFAVLATLGLPLDFTTAGVSDSNRAMKYSEPKVDGNHVRIEYVDNEEEM